MDLMRKGRIKGKGYILTEQEYCVVVGTINMDIRGWRISVTRKRLLIPYNSLLAGGVGRNIAHNLALLGRDVHLLSVIGDDFYGEMLLEETCRAGVNVPAPLVCMVKAHRRIWQLPIETIKPCWRLTIPICWNS
ncbi:PfkB family carbohydrate kinase [Escherichia coli]